MDNEEVKLASQHLRSVTVNQVVLSLFAAAGRRHSMSYVFHREGLNMRYLGLVFDKVQTHEAATGRSSREVRNLLLVEAISRAVKNIVREKLRQVTGNETLRLYEVTTALNVHLFELNNPILLESLCRHYHFSLADGAKAIESFLSMDEHILVIDERGAVQKSNLRAVALRHLCEMTGLVVRPQAISKLGVQHNQKPFFREKDFHFEDRIKCLDVLDRAQALSLYLKGTQKRDDESDEEDTAEMLALAHDTLLRALESLPADPWLTFLMGKVCEARWKLINQDTAELLTADPLSRSSSMAQDLVGQVNAREHMRAQAEQYFSRAMELDKQNECFRRVFGKFLLSSGGDKEKAEEVLVSALEISLALDLPLDEECIRHLVKLLMDLGKNDIARRLALLVDDVVPSDSSTMNPGEDAVDDANANITINVQLLDARGLLAADSNGLSDPYVKVYLPDSYSAARFKKKGNRGLNFMQSSVQSKTLDPIWNAESHQFTAPKKHLSLVVECWDWGLGRGDDFLGRAILSAEQLCGQPEEKVLDVALSKQGNIRLRVKCGTSLPDAPSDASESSPPRSPRTPIASFRLTSRIKKK